MKAFVLDCCEIYFIRGQINFLYFSFDRLRLRFLILDVNFLKLDLFYYAFAHWILIWCFEFCYWQLKGVNIVADDGLSSSFWEIFGSDITLALGVFLVSVHFYHCALCDCSLNLCRVHSRRGLQGMLSRFLVSLSKFHSNCFIFATIRTK